jgi:hypothetical protein
MLIENGLTDSGAICNFIHGGRVISSGGKDFKGRGEKYCSAFITRQTRFVSAQ